MIKSSVVIAKLLCSEGFTDKLGNQIEKYWKTSIMHRNRGKKIAKMEREFSELIQSKMSIQEKLLLGKFIALHKRMSFDAGLRIGLMAFQTKCAEVEVDAELPTEHAVSHEPEIIEHEGKRFVRTGEVRTPQKGEFYEGAGWGGVVFCCMDERDIPSNHREILRELPAEPAPAAQTGEAIRELAKAISRAHFSGMELAGFEGILTEALTPLLEKSEQFRESVIDHFVPDNPLLLPCIDCEEFSKSLAVELTRWRGAK